MVYVIVATYRAKPLQEDELIAHLEAMMAPTRAEEGCISYDVYRSVEDDRTFVLVEVYRDEEGFEHHCATPYFEEHILNGARPILESRDVFRGSPLVNAA